MTPLDPSAPVRRKLLLVDDLPINIKLLNEVLRDDYDIFFATSGPEAIQLAVTHQPDLILLDVVMPTMNGYDVLRQLKRLGNCRDIPVIFITSMSDEDDETQGLELGAVDYITKPFRPGIVRLRVRNHLEMKRQRDQLQNLSYLDGLTTLPNRRALDAQLEKEWRRAIRSQQPLSILLMDVDYFKKFNDRFGHLAGDDGLRKVAQALVRSIQRAEDFVARYGGEEFACILPNTEELGAKVVGERMRAQVEELRIPHVPGVGTGVLTISLGVFSTQPEPDSQHVQGLGLADAALYEAKKQGRNQVMAYSQIRLTATGSP
jgi:diguanylate cyclase (GGDEF)-like protein